MCSSWSNAFLTLGRCWGESSGSKAMWICCRPWANSQSLPPQPQGRTGVSWAGLAAWARLKPLNMHSVDASLALFLCWDWQCPIPSMSATLSQQWHVPQSGGRGWARAGSSWGKQQWALIPKTRRRGAGEKVWPQQMLKKERGRMCTARNQS